MARHRDLSFRRFVAAVPPDLLERYFQGLAGSAPDDGWTMLNGDALEQFLNKPENDGLDAIVRRDFRRINDLCDRGLSILTDAYGKFTLPMDVTRTPEELAMRLFLEYADAWSFAWSRYMFYAPGGKLSVYPMAVTDIDLQEDAREGFEAELKLHLQRNAKGGECQVRMWEHADQTIVYVERGAHMRTVAHWLGHEVNVISYRPALDDLLVLDHEEKTLKVKVQDEPDRVEYVRLFAKHCAGDEMLAVTAVNSKVFTLDPVRAEKFDYGGDSQIASINLVGVRLRVSAGARGTIDIRSADVFKTMAANTPGLSLRSGELVLARFRFKFTGKGRSTVTFEVAPPARTDLPDSMYTRAIEAYLKQQGVKLL